MNVIEKLLKVNSKDNCLFIVNYVDGRPNRFAELLNVVLQGDFRQAQIASLPFSYCVEKEPSLIKPHFNKIIPLLKDSKKHPAVARNILRLLQFVEIPVRYQGVVMDLCFMFISDLRQKPAVKAYALTVLNKLSVKYPEIVAELQFIIKENWERETPAFKARAQPILARKS